MKTGHERLCYCKEFDQRNNSATYSGIEAGRAYILEDFDDTELNFVSSAIRADSGKKYPEYKYSNTKSKEFTPEVTYNGNT